MRTHSQLFAVEHSRSELKVQECPELGLQLPPPFLYRRVDCRVSSRLLTRLVKTAHRNQ